MWRLGSPKKYGWRYFSFIKESFWEDVWLPKHLASAVLNVASGELEKNCIYTKLKLNKVTRFSIAISEQWTVGTL